MKLDWNHLSTSPTSKTLIVILHAYVCTRVDVRAVEKAAREKYGDADVYRPTMPMSRFSMRHPDEIVAALLIHIDQIWRSKEGSYDKVILVGHSMGALLARKLYLCACGETKDAPFAAQFDAYFDAAHFKDDESILEEDKSVAQARPWAHCVDRLVLLAGMNRGWQISHHLSLTGAAGWLLGLLLCRICMMFNTKPLIMHIKRGAVFLTELRVLWIHMQERASPSSEHKDCEPDKQVLQAGEKTPLGGALTVQLLGSIDDMVSPEDNIDLIAGRNFIYLDMPYSGHMSAVELGQSMPVDADRQPTMREMRTEVFQAALSDTPANLNERAVVPSDEMQPKKADPSVTDVIFVIHGIRDRGYWTHKVARRVLKIAKMNNRKAEAENQKVVKLATETSSYGYFAMLSFILPWRRQVKVEWLMDQYAEALALYPHAEFSFIGHSNGTYLLAKALRDYPLCKFKNVIFAGSVVPTNYDWGKIARRGQVERVMNFTATTDWVVALFPKIFQSLPIQDLGSAGHDGFRAVPGQEKFLTQMRYAGFHGAAIKEDNWDAMADFILTGGSERYPESLTPAKPSTWLLVLGELSLVLVAVIFGGLYLAATQIWAFDDPEWLKTVYLMLLGFVVFKIATKV